MSDQKGEAIAVVVQNGRPDKGMPKFDLPKDQIADIAAYLHSLNVSGSDAIPEQLLNIVVGDVKAGEEYFNGRGKCNTCHSVVGDLAAIGSKHDPKELQNSLVSGHRPTGMRDALKEAGASNPSPTTVKVTLASGEIVQGVLLRIDDFIVSLNDANGNRRTIRRNGNSPTVDVNNPLQAHIDLLRIYTDDDIHNLTAYLVTLK